jgi:hypothetical protein
MRRRTHNVLSKIFFPTMKMKDIDKINKSLDKPTQKMTIMQNRGLIPPGAERVFNLGKSAGHRKYNHSPQSAILAAKLSGAKGSAVAEAAILHLVADKMSNMIHDKIGTDRRDMFESMITMQYYDNKKLYSKPRRQRKMNW